MQEIVRQILGEIRSALRFRWSGLLLAWIVSVAGWGYVAWMPDIYEGTARFYIDTSSVLEPVLGNQIVSPDIEAQIATIREALLSRERLETVVQNAGLGERVQTTEQMELLLVGVRNSIQIETSRTSRSGPENIYNISYRHADRAKAVGVVRELLDSVVADTLSANQVGGDTAEQFLDERVAEYEARLQVAERALADFKKDNAERLPGAEGDYFARMQAERDALALAHRDLRILESKREQLTMQLSGQSPVMSEVDGAGDEPAPGSLDGRIREYQTELDAALLEYTERHPDVIALRQALAQLLKQREEELLALGLGGTDIELSGLASNPIYQSLQIAVNDTDVEIATLEADIRERTAKVQELQGLIDEVPEVEAQLARLNRDYDVVYEQYLALVRSRETQELTRKATDTDQVDFTIIDPPLAGLTPVAPQRLQLLALIFLAALGVGAGICYVCSRLWPVFSGVRDLRRQVELPVLGAVSHAWDGEHRAEKRQSVAAYMAALGLLILVFMGLVAVEMAGPGIHSAVELIT